MQLWRTTQSVPRMNWMKVRLVRFWCYVLTMLFQKSLASLSICSLCFGLPSEGKPKMETRSSQSLKELFKFRLEDLRKYVSDRIKHQVVVTRLSAFTGFNNGAVKVHSLGYCTVEFVLCDSVPVDARVNNVFLWDRGYHSRRAFL